ncbi:hypothetical protein BH11PLA1_BH11PLA1_19040 [soil metagenome]
MTRRAFKSVCAFSAAALVSLAGALGAPRMTIADLAPRDTLVCLGVDDASAVRALWAGSSLGKMLSDDQFKALWEGMKSEAKKSGNDGFGEMEKWMSDAGVKLEDLPSPTGTIGYVMFPTRDAKEGTIDTGWMMVSQFGDGADKMAEALDKVIDQMEKKKLLTVSEQEVAGVKARKIVLPEPKKPGHKHAAGAEAEGDDEMDFGGKDDRPFKEAIIARSGETFMVCSDAAALEAGLDRLSGKAKGETLAQTATYDLTRKQNPPTTVFHAAVFFDTFMKLIAENAGKMPEVKGGVEPSGLEKMLREYQPDQAKLMFTSLGIQDAKAAVMSISLDSESAVAEMQGTLLVPSRGGLLKLFEPMKGLTPPAFVGADSSMFMAMSFRFDQVLALVREQVKLAPAEARDQAEGMLTQAEGMAGPVLENMGPEVYVAWTIEQPYSLNSEHVLGAIKMKDATPLQNLLTSFGGGIGVKPRDFEGHQIFEGPEGGAPFALGMGLNYMFIGAPADIENALRQGGRAASAGLAGEARYTAAAKTFHAEPVLLTWSDMNQSLKRMYWTLQNPDVTYEANVKRMREMGMDPDAMGMKKPEKQEWVSKLPPLETVQKYVGDSLSEMYWTDDGLKFRTRMLRPVK